MSKQQLLDIINSDKKGYYTGNRMIFPFKCNFIKIIVFLKLSHNMTVTWVVHIDENATRTQYDMIVGSELMEELELQNTCQMINKIYLVLFDKFILKCLKAQ